MFRLHLAKPPAEPTFPADFKALGYFINDQDRIKSIADPTQDFNYKVYRNERFCELSKEAFHGCVRQLVISRLAALGLALLPLPLGTPPQAPHVPILVSRSVAACKRVVVVIGEASHDLGIWAYRHLCNGDDGGIATGSALALVQRLTSDTANPTGVIIANPGQLVWSRRFKQAMSYTTWNAMPGRNACEPPPLITEANAVPGNETVEAHVRYVFEDVIPAMVDEDAKIDVIGVSDGATAALKYLDENWSEWSDSINALAFAAPIFKTYEVEDAALRAFMVQRARAFVVSDQPKGEMVASLPDSVMYGCPAIASGEADFPECVMPKAYEMVVDFLADVAREGDGFANLAMPFVLE